MDPKDNGRTHPQTPFSEALPGRETLTPKEGPPKLPSSHHCEGRSPIPYEETPKSLFLQEKCSKENKRGGHIRLLEDSKKIKEPYTP